MKDVLFIEQINGAHECYTIRKLGDFLLEKLKMIHVGYDVSTFFI